jgi:ketosteroid isomerase-like protein
MKRFHHQLIENFYTAFRNNDSHGMINCYHENIVFEDPVFGRLKGEKAKDMWKMLIKRSEGKIQVFFKNVKADNINGSAEWEAIYNFSKTGRKVHNKVTASFEFEDGRIIKHTDHFNLWKWSMMALGPVGILFWFNTRIRKKYVKLR